MQGPVETLKLTVSSEDAMTRLGKRLALELVPGDTLLLSGPIGAGKTHLARAIIHSLLDEMEEVPSPTFTLVQTYEFSGGTIWHADLYRLGDSSELVELGLDDAIGEAVVIIEWPDRLPPDIYSEGALEIDIRPSGDIRDVIFRSSADRWTSKFDGALND